MIIYISFINVILDLLDELIELQFLEYDKVVLLKGQWGSRSTYLVIDATNICKNSLFEIVFQSICMNGRPRSYR